MATKTMEKLTKNACTNTERISIYEQHYFVNSLVDFEEDIDMWDNRDILPAFPKRECYIPIPEETTPQ